MNVFRQHLENDEAFLKCLLESCFSFSSATKVATSWPPVILEVLKLSQFYVSGNLLFPFFLSVLRLE